MSLQNANWLPQIYALQLQICHRVPKIEQQESLLLDSRTGNTRGDPGGGGNSRPSPWGHLEIIETNAAHPASWPCMFGFDSVRGPEFVDFLLTDAPYAASAPHVLEDFRLLHLDASLMSEQQSAKAGVQDCPPGYGSKDTFRVRA
ncbi:hypothetical protein D8B26_005537 [Coccidioides posadasii str. Silveira]|uniref:Uncharacterized protein n=1 Tax=Coccidioides posadasii RMSCC 3488 TaxID=454284 RepID=A0A0J6FGU1_COCPO|nr:hypothetical protein CPAG_08651 [Coccidioides posadasii RMSCC 3488]QVM10886.1 hypothetical protein D8B26_005537 [Coccidioides posadasii str. Silveira]